VQSFLSLGRFHIPVYGLFAAVGLIAAMALGQWTARRAKLDPDAIWDAGMVTVFAAFVLSRLLLVAENLRTFLVYPVLVLELPSLTKEGALLTAIVAVLYLRRRHLPLLTALDADAPCVALLTMFLCLGRFAEGTRDGMPATVPWAVPSSFGRVQPVELYAAFAALVLCVVLLWILRAERQSGVTVAWGLLLGGLLIFLLDFFRLPQMLYGTRILDGEEWRGLEVFVAGSLLLAWRVGIGSRSVKGVGNAV
jgi:phosphatidylglycerol---prolipoprotein diacylglyceryl transferase